MVRDLILEETSKLHNKALAHITTVCKYIHHPDVGQRLCVLYKNAIISILNNGQDTYTGSELATMMIGVGEINNVGGKDRTKHGTKAYHTHLTAAFATDQNEIERPEAQFKMTLYRALGINKSASGALPTKGLMEQVHRALQLENHKEFSKYIESRPLIQSSQKHDDEIKGGPSSLLEIAKKIPEVVNIRKIFYRNNFYTDAQRPTGSKSHSRDKVILMHEKEIKEQLNRISRNISTTSNPVELMHVSNALGITSIPFKTLTENQKTEYTKIDANSILILSTEIVNLTKNIYDRKITSHKLEDNPDSSDIKTAFECIASYKDVEKKSKNMNSESMLFMSFTYEANWNSHGWLRREIGRYTYGIIAEPFTTIGVTCALDEETKQLPRMFWDKTSSRLNMLNNIPMHQSTETAISYTFDVVQHIHHDQYVKEHNWLTVVGINKVVNPTEPKDEKLIRYDPRSAADKQAATAAKAAAIKAGKNENMVVEGAPPNAATAPAAGGGGADGGGAEGGGGDDEGMGQLPENPS